MRQAADTWCKVIDFQRIEYLHLYQCTGADALLDQLCKAAHLPKLLKAFTLQHIDNPENEGLLALDGFLCLVSGIRDLIIDIIHAKDLPATAGLVRHGKTLETLNVHAWRDPLSMRPPTPPPPPSAATFSEELVYKLEDLSAVCGGCKSLTQLSIGWPSYSIVKPLTADMLTYERLVAGQLKHLVTLNLSGWPSSSTGGTNLPRSIYEILLQAAALRIFNLAAYWSDHSHETDGLSVSNLGVPSEWKFESSSTPKLRVIAFGISDRIYERLDSKTQVIYLRSTCQDAEGKTKLHAAPIGWCLKQFVEPVSDVLNTSLLRAPKLPLLGNGMRWDQEEDYIIDD